MTAFAWLDQPGLQRLWPLFPPNELRAVGGCVRNSLLGLPIHDIDLATSLPPSAIIDVLRQANIPALEVGRAFGTIIAVLPDASYEITTLRHDVLPDGRKTTVAFTDNWAEDAQRRDFTINGLYVDAHGTLYDYVYGQADIQQKKLRFIGDPSQRIHEDYLRILRYFRFFSFLNGFQPDPSSLLACQQLAGQLSRLSRERVRQEMIRLLQGRRRWQALQLMQQSALPVILPHAHLEKMQWLLEYFPYASPLVCLASLYAPALEQLPQDFLLHNDEKKILRHVKHCHDYPLHTLSGLARWFDDTRCADLTADWLAVLQISLCLNPLDKKIIHNIIQWNDDYKSMWDEKIFPLNGHDLQLMGLAPSTAMGQTLRKARQLWQDSLFTLTKEQLLRHIIN